MLSANEIEQVYWLADSLGEPGQRIDDGLFLARVAMHARELPRNLRRFLADFRASNRSPACLVLGYPVDEVRMGPSPTACNRLREKTIDEIRLEIAAILISSCLGDVFGWRLQHEGSIIHDLAPRPEHEDVGLGTGSRQHINWHTEDSFHPYRADYVGLFCVRNSHRVATTIGALDPDQLSKRHRRLLSAPLFTFRPDPSYLMSKAHPLPGTDRGGILFGDPENLCLRFDQDYIDWPDDIDGIAEAVETLRRVIEASLIHMPLRSGDFLLLNNRRAVHGRPAFTPTYRGTDRWLKRINITRNLERSRRRRQSDFDRVIYV
ncbi:TauD/TfdA family dioxygenase [Nocardia sp. NPDC050710]|uniref:TauD/TfdA family dioxygenase n=1 Tax=Nocardia sp. NPDC050710 TaxID=3157220 RepID=UPI0033E0B754